MHFRTIGVIIFFSLSISAPEASFAQDREYEVNWNIDAPLLAGGAVMAITGNLLKEEIDPLGAQEILELDDADINLFDRSAVGNFSEKDATTSDVFAAVAFVSPIVFAFDKRSRSDVAPIIVMLAETALLSEGIISFTKVLSKRSRPFVYNPTVSLEQKQTSNARQSFFSGHTAHTAAYSFFTANLIDHYSENKTVEVIAWSSAVVLPTTVGYLRFSSGNHFPTDIIAGFAVGAGIGILVPVLHKSKSDSTSLQIFPGAQSLCVVYRF